MPTAFASSEPLTATQLDDAPLRYPRPSVLDEPLRVSPKTAAAAAASIDLHTVGDLLEHLPRDTGAARTIAELEPDETATVIAEVRSITSRPVRRRGMKPLVEAVVADATGVMKVTFFNQPWLLRAYPPGTRLMLNGKYQARNSFRVSHHAQTEELASAGGEVAEYPATKGITSTQILALVGAHVAAIDDVIEPLPARIRVAERLPDRRSAIAEAHFGDTEAGRVRLAFDELLVEQLVQERLGAQRRAATRATAIDAEPVLSGPWRRDQLPFTPTGDQDAAMAQIDAGPCAVAPDATAADGRSRLGQDRRRPARDSARGRRRAPGGADGADRDAGRTALRHRAGADARCARAGRAADRRDDGLAPRGDPDSAGQR